MSKNSNPSILTHRQQVNEQRRLDQQRKKRRTVLIQGAAIVAALALVGGTIFAVSAVNSTNSEVVVPSADAVSITVGGVAEVPLTIDATAIRIGAADAPVEIAIYEDFSCPHCQDYEAEVGDTLDELVAEGLATVAYHPMQIVTSYGIRAGNAATCIAVSDPENYPALHSSLFAIHDETTTRWGNDEIADYLAEQGVNDAAVDCAASGTFDNWIEANTDAALDAGVQSTPTLMINGEATDLVAAAELRSTVETLAAG